MTPVVPVLKSVAAAGQKSANAKAAIASSTTDEYQELDEDNLRLQGPKQKLFVLSKLTQFEVSAQVILDTEDKFDLEYFKLVKFTHPRFGSSHDHGANVTEVQAGDGSDKVDLLFSWVP
ncbi:hypothetical protein [Psychrosphaera algicola]|uniref:Uncharacterized protein n=1 Tax=Psychrosphaera algicola TaxID=3023714 RepID=A0ABT5FBB1_9GAMM|nr:hypothetical protein [Psychrosphaera sp. G1-22]MDC2888686.1 hypothetical protein [Psychrosphaera sp. G1-22]